MGKKKNEKTDERNDEAKAENEKADRAKAKDDKRKEKNEKAKADKAKAKADKAEAKDDKRKEKKEKAKADKAKANAKDDKRKEKKEKAKAKGDKAKGDKAKAKGDKAKAKGDKARGDKAKGDKAKGDKAKGDKAKGDKTKAKGDKAKGDKAKSDERRSKADEAEAKDDKRRSKADEANAKKEKAKAKKGKANARDDERKSKNEKAKAKSDERSSEDGRRIPLTLLEEVSLGLRSASAIAPIGAGRSLVVDDDEGLYLVEADGRAEHLAGRAHAEALGDLESLCTSDDGKTAYVVAEESGDVLALSVRKRGDAVTLSAPRTLGSLVRPGDTENKGWEGACFLAPTAARGACLVVAHEREPMALAVYALPSLALLASISLDDGPIGALIDDVADVALCPSTDHLFLLSDQSHRIVEARLDVERASLEVLATFDLSLHEKDKPEGIAFEAPARLVVVTDDPSRLLRFALARDRRVQSR
jgi:uncharacterized protein YjiK